MKLLYKIIIALLFAVVVLSAIGTLYYFNRINSEYDEGLSYDFSDDAKYHFSLILKTEDEVYWQDFIQGVYEAAKANNSAVEYNPVFNPDSNSKMVKYIDIASKSKVDGVIVNGNNTAEYASAINVATDEGLNVVLGGIEAADSSRLSYVGTNFYEYGINAAKLIKQIDQGDESINLAVILSIQNDSGEDQSAPTQSDIMMNGLKSVIDSDNRVNLVSTQYRNSNLLGAEDLTRNILTKYDDIDIIFCTNAKDTIAATRVIIERNLVGDVYIVGTDVTEDIINYIKKGIVFGVLDRNGYEAGYNSIEILHDNLGNNFQPSYIDIDINIYTNLNIATYKKDWLEDYEHNKKDVIKKGV